ncbi:biotin carboxylase N-terminal domain-containing protein [Cryobacterium sp. CG_9.6]|uniref:acetyl/propionyl/methylcrotonyl-CoA carboxylase subunit alpha n=1 Tax=Cryobacterium sp. CG_9.6 TaxID=2760710 RepID=UPI0024763645|nr:biotin carboxylase N-terminal domain-containing protein [Cryobacterium sp. CG_9.6]MDH6236587.1 acetyl-CoA/propionyl-CoA carboxylase biotin carboxyl carrier protein [Cryobacterium sp. CG_9.6]
MTATHATTFFDTVLVANRGEIACRIIRTLRAQGIRSIAVYSDADRNARHVSLADAAVRLGGPAPADSYLNVHAVLDAAAQTGAQAIHPGYGFLSENESFARLCADAGIVFIGPSVHALTMMGDKIRSKNHVAGYGVPTIPGIAEPGLSNAQLIEAAASVGYPMLIKPSAGGGGKGMHVVEREEDLAETLETARRVALGAFGDDTLLIERLIATPRHIEVQVLADNYGATIHLGERECSLQRRHQKVIEEAPSPLLDEATRARIGEAACAAARSVGYTGAGTVEFLVSDAAPGEFFFMEMNTRLQVEHPVTEMVTGIDLVDWQVRIAAGEPLTLLQSDVHLTGHAIEARLYAENPERGFLPTTGTVLRLQEAQGEGIRVDSSLVDGLDIASHYDPMLAKVIAWAPTRLGALTRLDQALGDTVVLGVHTNIEYLRLLLQDPDVRAGHLDTGLIERRLPTLAFRGADDHLLAAAALFLHQRALEESTVADANGVWARPTGWRLGEPRASRYCLGVSATESVDVWVLGMPSAASVTVDRGVGTGTPVAAGIRVTGDGSVSADYRGMTRVYEVAHRGTTAGGAELYLGAAGFSLSLRHRSRAEQLAEHLLARDRVPGTMSPDVRSPMPGTVITVNAASGDAVEAGQTLLVVEAMKMEHKLVAQTEGRVTINVGVGALVKLDQIVATVTPEPSPDNTTDKGATQ